MRTSVGEAARASEDTNDVPHTDSNFAGLAGLAHKVLVATRPAVATATTAKPNKLNHRLLIRFLWTSYPKEAIAIPPVIMTSQTIQCIALREPRAAQLPIFAFLAIDASQLPFGGIVQLSQSSSYLSI